VSFLFLGK